LNPACARLGKLPDRGVLLVERDDAQPGDFERYRFD
jgi:hypothetical protein